MTETIPSQRLMQFLQATPEQQVLINRVLDGWKPEDGGQRVADGGGSRPAAEPFITKAEVAMRLDKDVRTITTYMRKGWLPHYKMGQTVMFKWSEVEKQLATMCRVNRGRL